MGVTRGCFILQPIYLVALSAFAPVRISGVSALVLRWSHTAKHLFRSGPVRRYMGIYKNEGWDRDRRCLTSFKIHLRENSFQVLHFPKHRFLWKMTQRTTRQVFRVYVSHYWMWAWSMCDDDGGFESVQWQNECYIAYSDGKERHKWLLTTL